MIKTTRQIRTEEDRFGGYIPRAETGRRNVEVDLNVNPDTELHFSRREAFVEPEIESPVRPEPKREEPLYSTRENPRATVAAPTRKRTAAKLPAEDVMPTIRTEAEPTTERAMPAPRNESLLSRRTKIMLAVYSAIAVVLAVIVIATGIALSSGTARVTALEQTVAARNETLAAQTAEILNLENDTMLTGLAVRQGMTKVSSVTEFDLLPVVDQVEVTARTNWFDRFCDWLSNII